MDELLRRLHLLFAPQPLRVAVPVMASTGSTPAYMPQRPVYMTEGPAARTYSGAHQSAPAETVPRGPATPRAPVITELDLLRAFGCDI
ncbi:hypothetical protein GCM10010841_10820 [Deinococcus aerophilus]|uniref:Uncharacterized protein n=2 Tax=Deinococcus aerophilus TaxID=522488 RepID=A0ABQ2GMV3_9DEIO|nr:hypothetical protein GCM10010841_10820 [Deinococcus aerophilus]